MTAPKLPANCRVCPAQIGCQWAYESNPCQTRFKETVERHEKLAKEREAKR